MKYLSYFIIIFSTFNALAQHRVQKSFSGENISAIHIDGDAVFKISIETTTLHTISITSKVEGENSEHVVLISEIKNNSLFLATAFQPLFNDANDKLSAHKVISIELVLKVPVNTSINMSSDIASVFLKGQYKTVTIELINGNCILKDFTGEAQVNTIQGDIDVFTNFAKLDAYTQNGTLNLEAMTKGNHLVSLYSINGNITVTKSQ